MSSASPVYLRIVGLCVPERQSHRLKDFGKATEKGTSRVYRKGRRRGTKTSKRQQNPRWAFFQQRSFSDPIKNDCKRNRNYASVTKSDIQIKRVDPFDSSSPFLDPEFNQSLAIDLSNYLLNGSVSGEFNNCRLIQLVTSS